MTEETPKGAASRVIGEAPQEAGEFFARARRLVLATVDERFSLTGCNAGFTALTGSAEPPIGRPLEDFLHEPAAPRELCADEGKFNLRKIVTRSDGGATRELRGVIVRLTDGYALLGECLDEESDPLIAEISSINEELTNMTRELHRKNAQLERANKRIEQLARTDGLTGLNNRRYFMEELDKFIKLARRHGHCLSLVMCDLDHFKQLNDEYGHPAGDEALKTVAEVLRESCRDVDIAGRYGGEEFVLLLPDTDLEEGVRAAERLRKRIEACTADQLPNTVTASLGVTNFANDDTTESMVSRADQALYHAKEEGRNRVADMRGEVVAD